MRNKFNFIFASLLFLVFSISLNAQTVGELQSAYSGTTSWNSGTGTLTFTSTGTINFTNKTSYKNNYWDVPQAVSNIVINANVTVTGAFHFYYAGTIQGVNRYTSIVYGTNEQSWAINRGIQEWNYCQFQNWGSGEMTVKNLTALNPFSYFIRGWGKINHAQSCDFKDTRGGYGNHSDGFEGGHGSTVDDCYFETGDDVIKCYFNLTVTNTTIKMIANSVPFQFGWGTYANSTTTLSNVTVTGTGGRNANHPIFNWVSGTDTKIVNMSNCTIQNSTSDLFDLKSSGNLTLTITNANIAVKAYGTASFPGTRTICGTTAQQNTYNCISANPVAYYKFENNANDSQGSYNGTAYGSPTYTSGVSGNAMNFDGVNDYVSIPRSISNDFTIAFWIKTTQVGTNAAQWYGGKGLVDGEVAGVANDFGVSLTGGQIAFGVGNADYTIKSNSSINNGAWRHVAVTRSSSSGQMQIYIDAVLEKTGTGPTGAKSSPPSLHIGNLQTNINYFLGVLDNVRLYTSVLSQADIQQLKNNLLKEEEENSTANQPIPTGFILEQNYPNPFNPTTTINYQISDVSNVTIKVFDVLGREVATLVNGAKEAGYYKANFNASNLPSGIYYAKFIASPFSGSSSIIQVKKMMLVK